MHIIIIGGGPSGLTAAIKAASNGAQVTLLERNNKLGKKLLLTGNGRCNFWNENQDITKYQSENIELFKELWQSKKDEILPFFHSLGIIEKNIQGYYYPFSKEATTILTALENKLTSLGVTIKLNEYVTQIIATNNFKVYTENNIYEGDKLILAGGSKAFPKTGSDGNSYELIKSLGHTLTPILPSLVQLKGQDSYYKLWAGVRSNVILTLKENGKIIRTETGEIQFTDYGISGICTFNLSGLVAKGLNNNCEEIIYINLVPWHSKTKEDFKLWLTNKSKELNGYNLKAILSGFLNSKLVNFILKLAKVEPDIAWKNAPQDKIVDLLKSFPFKVTSTLGFDKSQVCLGGVPLTEVNMKTLESKIIKNLYIVGELLDITGECGGYNLGIAWITGLTAGEEASKNVKIKTN